MILLCFVTHFK